MNARSTRIAGILSLLSLASTLGAVAQEDVTLFNTEARSAFVWGEDTPGGAVSWTTRDPLTGAGILKLKYGGIEVSSRMGFEKLRTEQAQELIAYTTTIVNNTRAAMSVESGETTVEGHIVLPLSIAPANKIIKKKPSKHDSNVIESGRLYCFSSGFLSDEHFLPPNERSLELAVAPQHSLTVSSVVRDPRHDPILCTMQGCLPKGTIRYLIRIGSHDFVFIWPGRSIVNCGK